MATDPLAINNVNDPDVLEYMLKQGGLNAEVSDQDRQAAMAHQLRQMSATPEGRSVKASTGGSLYTAANPLEHLASGIGNVMAARQEAGVRDKMSSISGQRQDAMQKLADTLKSRQGGGAPAGYAAVDTGDETDRLLKRYPAPASPTSAALSDDTGFSPF